MKLNLGCGPLRLDGFVGVDRYAAPSVDVVADLMNFPWMDAQGRPLAAEGSVEEVRAWHVLEHLWGMGLDSAMREVHRILRPGGLLYVKVPYREGDLYNPFHAHVFNRRTFDAWIEGAGTTLEGGHLFVRKRQEVVYVSGFPAWHIFHRMPWLEGILFERDERGAWTKIPSRGRGYVRELREWLVKA